MSLVLSLFVIFITAQVHSCSFVSEKLVEYITYQSNPDVIPRKTLDTPVNLQMSMHLINIKEADQKKNQVEIDAWLSLSWNGGVAFDPREFNNITSVRVPYSKIWLPDLAVYNGDIQLTEYIGNRIAVIQNNGEALWVPPSKIRVPCDLGDENVTCQVKIGSWSYSAKELYLEENTEMDIGSYNPHSKYTVKSVSARRESKMYSCCPEEYQTIIFTFSFVKK